MNRPALHPVRSSQNGRGAFTLVEMLVVITIITILVVIVVGVSQIVTAKAGTEKTKLNMEVIVQAIEIYRDTAEGGLYPPSTAGNVKDRNVALYTALTGNPAARERLGPLDDNAILSVGGNDCFVDGFSVMLDYDDDGGAGGTPVLISAGPDGEMGTTKDNIRSDNQ